jgi:transcriptional regulator with XRE-family HTH domain
MKDEVDRRWHDLGEFIREQRNVGQMSLRKLSELAGVSNPYLSQIERGLRRPSAEILQQIARALEISSETLYVRAGILDEPGTEVDPVAEIRRDPKLTEEQKKTLVRIYDSFRRENEVDRIVAEATDSADADADADGPAGATDDLQPAGVAGGGDPGEADDGPGTGA